MIDERIEHLITRRLDGELTSAEELELNKALIRSPQARAVLAEYERTDALAAAALKAALGEVEASGPPTAQRWSPPHVREPCSVRYVTGLACVVGIAAVIMALVGPMPPPVTSPKPGDSGAGLTQAGPVETVADSTTIDGPRVETERTDRDVFGLYDQASQSLYLLEVDNVRSTIVPVRMNY